MRLAAPLSIAGFLLSGSALCAALHGSSQDYTFDGSVAKLTKIGKALQLYRQESGIKPVGEWESPADAGLPPLMTILTRPGHPWSVSPETFKLPSAAPPHPQRKSDFAQIFLPPGVELDADSPYRDFGRTMRSRGEKLPTMGDFYLGNLPKYKDLYPRQFVLVLRLDGTVEVVEHSGKYGELLNK